MQNNVLLLQGEEKEPKLQNYDGPTVPAQKRSNLKFVLGELCSEKEDVPHSWSIVEHFYNKGSVISPAVVTPRRVINHITVGQSLSVIGQTTTQRLSPSYRLL